MTESNGTAKHDTRALLDAFFEKKSEVATVLRDLGSIATEVGAKSLGERIAHDLVKKLDEDRFHLVVVGEFAHRPAGAHDALMRQAAREVVVQPGARLGAEGFGIGVGSEVGHGDCSFKDQIWRARPAQ